MSTYKLIQDIEAEDHILGPLTLRQFIYALVAVFLYYICYFLYTKGAAFLLIVFLPPALFFSFFAFPFGRDQSTEVWALAKLRFFIKPRRRVWDQSGMKELVTITVPKKIERILTDGLSQGEVKSRLSALANTLDSRGWAVKNVNVNGFAYVDPFTPKTSDRLLDMSNMPREVPADVYASDDILDTNNSPVAQQFATMIDRSEREHRQEVINKMNNMALAERIKPNQPQQPSDYWFMNQPPSSALAPNETMFASNQVVQPGINDTNGKTSITPEEQAILDQAKARNQSKHASNAHLRTVQPLGSVPVQPSTPKPSAPMTPPNDPAIIQRLASDNDKNIETLAREAKKELHSSDDEVVISLH